MKKILHIISSPRGKDSFSIQLGNAILEKLKIEYPGSTVTEYDLVKAKFPHLEESHLGSFFTPPENRNPAQLEAVKHSDDAIQQLFDADIIVIGAPMYNFNIHSSLKAWIDHIVRSGKTFTVDSGSAEGLLHNKKVFIAVSSGFIYSKGPMQPMDFVTPYLKTMLAFIGLKDITIFRVEGTALPEVKETALEKGIASIQFA
jgi:FMN-dependent NADH-azoreductase